MFNGETPCTFTAENLYLEARAAGDPLTRRIIDLFPDARIFEIRDHRRLEQERVPVKGSLRARMRRLCADPAEAQKRALRSLHDIRELTWEVCARRLRDLLLARS